MVGTSSLFFYGQKEKSYRSTFILKVKKIVIYVDFENKIVDVDIYVRTATSSRTTERTFLRNEKMTEGTNKNLESKVFR